LTANLTPNYVNWYSRPARVYLLFVSKPNLIAINQSNQQFCEVFLSK